MTVMALMAVVLICAGAALIGYSAWVYQDDAYQVLAPDKHRATLKGTQLEVYREFKIRREITLYIDRELVLATRDGDGQIISVRAALTPTEVTYHAGIFRNRRFLDIPAVPAGLYQLVSRVCWQMPVARRCAKLPALEVAVP